MCGIFGIIDQQDQPVEPAELMLGLKALAHRGPDDQGTFQKNNLALGHQRLAVFDLTEFGRQPMTYRGKTIVFNGAIYNFPELKSELGKKGYQFQTNTDTEMILAAYDQWGEECVDRFNGQWAFAIYDPERQIVFCSRDRFGIKPFYYTVFKGRFHFASEIKAFTRQAGWRKNLNVTRTYEFLAYGLHDHTSDTMYEGVFQLPQGNHLIYDLNRHSWVLKKYYHLEAKVVDQFLPFEEACEKFRSLLLDAVRIRLRADVPLGSALSGGLDSSSLVRLMQELLGDRSLTTVSVCFPESPEIDESRFIDALQQDLPFESLRLTPDREAIEALQEKVAWHQDEPLSSNSIIAQYLVFQQARSAGLTAMLDGQGADEILGGYIRFYAPYYRGLLRSNPLQLLPAFWNFVQLHYWSWSFIRDKMTALNAKSKGLVPAWIHPDFFPDPEKQYRPAAVHSMTQLSIELITRMGLPALLHYEDRNAMAHGVESRLPFLDHRLVEYALSLPDDHRIHRSRRKFILREAMKSELPEVIYRRYDKLGFAVPDWSPTPDQLRHCADNLQAAGLPILNSGIKVEQLPGSIKERIFFFSQFMQ